MTERPKPTSKADYAIKKNSPSTSSSIAKISNLGIPFSKNQFSVLASPKPNSFSQVLKNPPSQSPDVRNMAQFEIKSPASACSSPSQNPFDLRSQYIYKTEIVPVLALERKYHKSNPSQIISELFLPQRHWPSCTGDKPRKFYEFILVDTDSVLVTHTPNRLNLNETAFSKCQILKVLSLEDWNQAPHTPKSFSVEFMPPTYTYFDYIEAWDKCFLFQNSSYNHTWFFHFCPKTKLNFPLWFSKWFHNFGPDGRIFPPQVLESFQYYCESFIFPDYMKDSPPLLMFLAQFSLCWIAGWEYVCSAIAPFPCPPHLCRRFKFKWWDSTKIDKVTRKALEEFFRVNPHLCRNPPSTANDQSFLSAKALIQSSLAASGSKAEFRKKMKEALSQVGSDSDNEETAEVSSTNLVQQNEDDCYGLDFFSQM